MQFAIGLALLMMVACVYGGPPSLPEESLLPQCRTPKCPPTGSVNLAFPMDCLLYVKCHQGVSKITACPADTHFNEATGSCGDRATANCVNCWQKVSTR